MTYSVFVPILHFLYLPKGPASLLQNEYLVPFPIVMRSGRSFDQQPPSSAEIIEPVELYIYHYPFLLPSCYVRGRTMPLYFTYWHQRLHFSKSEV
jgi:hypothetical protein